MKWIIMNSLWIEIKYANLISYKLPLQSQKDKDSRYALNFRCVLCGDSRSNKHKKRGWIYEKDNHLFYKCFNCQHASYFTSFLKDFDPSLYKEYSLEIFKEKMLNKPPEPFVSHIEKYQKRRIQKFDPFKDIERISQLESDHPAKAYIVSRKIPPESHYRIFYVDKFYKWVNTVLPDKFDPSSFQYDEPRIILPFIDQDGYVFGFQGRSLNPDSKSRYISIMIDESKPKIFGLESVDFSKTVMVTEGPIDSLFLSNAVAMAGADGQIDQILNRTSTIIVFDNEPRNPEIVSRYHKYIDLGWTVCLWPPEIKEKDINDMVSSGISADEVRDIIIENSYSGLSAKMKMINWSKF